MISFAVLLMILNFQSCSTIDPETNKTTCLKPKVGHCSCECPGVEYCRVTCKGLDTVPEELPPQTSYLEMTDGSIKEIPTDYLKNTNHLYEINLSNNSITNSFYIPKLVYNLDLSRNSLRSSTLFGMLRNLTSLTTLDLSRNPLNDTLIPGTFIDLENLDTLLIMDCGIKDLKVGTFHGLKKLRKVNIESNQISVLKRGILDGIGQRGKPSLKDISFHLNKISYIEDGIFEGQQIRGLYLHVNRLTSLPDLTGLCSHIRELRLSENYISDISALSKSGIKSIVKLKLDHNNISMIPSGTFDNIDILTVL
ncbi:slit homolog 3 protein [Exaiptasia diaphana]|uniref:LRRNT domain-containing protein n=1 Tax=Exaiptasia diaphana TaxID=2652724 RepID=A0A913YNY5_EXADI|nr:slit homolog 3 protein [Exaiptasia diaphana]